MAKLLSGNTVIAIQNEEWGTSVFESHEVILSSKDKGLTHDICVRNSTQSSEPGAFSRGEEPQEVERDSEHEKKVQEHTNVLLDVLKQVESTRLNAAIRREKLEAELAQSERADRVALRFAVFNATQAGVSEEEVTRRLRDDHANYVADVYDEVRLHTDLDNTAATQEHGPHEQNTY